MKMKEGDKIEVLDETILNRYLATDSRGEAQLLHDAEQPEPPSILCASVTCTLSSQFIAGIGDREYFFFYKDKGVTWQEV